MPRKKRNNQSKMPIITLVLLIILSIMTYAIVNIIDQDEYLTVNVLEVSGTTIIVGNNCTAIVAETSPERAYSILLGLEDRIEERPTTHDVFVETLKSFNITLDSIQIENFDGKYYYAFLVLMSGDKILKLDTKPSDAIALAVRSDAEMYVSKELLEKVGNNIC